MICCGYDSDFGKFWFRLRFRIQTKFSTVFQNRNFFAQSLAFSMSEAAYIPERWPLIFDFFLLFIIAFTLDTDPNPVPALEPEPEPYLVTHSVSCSAKAKSYGSIGSGSGATTLADSN